MIYAWSVFTYLDQDRQDDWLRELRRVLAPRGTPLFTVHGEQIWKRARHRREHLDTLRPGGFLFTRSSKMSGICPDWYHTAFHAREHVLNHAGALFEIAAYIPGDAGVHDAVVARKPQ